MAEKKAKTTTKKDTSRKPASARKTAKPTKKAAPKASPKPLHEEIAESRVKLPVRKPTQIRFKRSYVIGALVVILIVALLYVFRGLFVVATVNGQPISRLTVVSELEQQSGKQALDSIVTKTLILQQAQKNHITVSDQEVDTEVKSIEDNLQKQGQNLDQVLAMQGLTRSSLRDQVKIQKIVEKMLGKNIKVTDKEINDYIAANKASLPQNENEAQLKKTVSDQLKQQKLSDKFQTWLQDIRRNAKINYIVSY